MTTLRGISSTLFPEWFLSEVLAREPEGLTDDVAARAQRHLRRWWPGVAATCGPASGLRLLFDVAAMPLFGLLGFRAQDARFERTRAHALLRTRGGRSVPLLLLPWAARPSAAWRGVWMTADDAGSRWCFVLAPPFLSLVETRGCVVHRSVDFTLPDVLERGSLRVFWTLSSASSFEAADDRPAPIDRLLSLALHRQDRVRGDLRRGVIDALRAMSRVIEGSHADGRVAQALTIVYRVLFLKFVESRRLVPMDEPMYARSYAMEALCRDALRAGSQGLWEGLAAATRLARQGCRNASLVLPPFNGRLFARSSAPSLERRRSPRISASSSRRDEALRAALLSLATRKTVSGLAQLDFRDLGVEELGSVYERVLDVSAAELLADSVSDGPVKTRPASRHSTIRKQTGTFYTPRALTEFVVARTLDPLVAGLSADALLTLRVLDPAMGSGAFLVCACRYLAGAYERALIEEGRASPADLDEPERANIRRLVAERCLAGVDVNPVAVQLARLSLWLTTLAPGKPLGFLDHRLRVGNSLVGASAEDLSRFPTRGRSRVAALPLFDMHDFELATRGALDTLTRLHTHRDDAVSDVRAKERLWAEVNDRSSPLHPWRSAADLWCAQWFWPACEDGAPSASEMRTLLAAVLNGDRTLPSARVARRLAEAASAAKAVRFFHWPLEFGDVFFDPSGGTRSGGGFDAVLGNPPWEMLRRDSASDAGAQNEYGPRHLLRFIRDSGVYADSAGGHLNLCQPFLERALTLCRPGGQVGLVLPWSVAVDDGAARLRQRLFGRCRLRGVVGFENAQGLFPIHRGVRFAAIVATPGAVTIDVSAAFGVRTSEQVERLLEAEPGDARRAAGEMRLSVAQVARIGGPSLRIPFVRRQPELAMADRLATEFPTFGSDCGWRGRFGRELNATEDRHAFGANGLLVIEGKHIEPFRTREGDSTVRIPRDVARHLLPDRRFERRRLAYRDVSGYSNRLSLIAAIVPPNVVTTHTLYCLRDDLDDDALHFLCGVFNSFVLNAIVRMLMGSHLTTSLVEQLPVPPFGPDARHHRVARLARARGKRSSQNIDAALQAQVAHVYRLTRKEFATVLEGFPLVASADRGRALARFEAEPRP